MLTSTQKISKNLAEKQPKPNQNNPTTFKNWENGRINRKLKRKKSFPLLNMKYNPY